MANSVTYGPRLSRSFVVPADLTKQSSQNKLVRAGRTNEQLANYAQHPAFVHRMG